jgi:hypothetical protein
MLPMPLVMCLDADKLESPIEVLSDLFLLAIKDLRLNILEMKDQLDVQPIVLLVSAKVPAERRLVIQAC